MASWCTNASLRAQELAKRNGDEPVVDGAFSSADIPQPAKETCRNWFYKTACIRELVPRLYVEMALMKCYNFLENGVIRRVVTRSSGIISRNRGHTCCRLDPRLPQQSCSTATAWRKRSLASAVAGLSIHLAAGPAHRGGGVKEDNGSGDGNIDGVPTEHGKMLRSRRITHKEYTRLHRPAFK